MKMHLTKTSPLAILLMIGLIGCARNGPPVHFVLPDGYRGAFKLVVDGKRGVPLKLRDGRYLIRIPKSGVLKVKSFDPFYIWHKETASYVNGTKIPDGIDRNFGERNPEAIAFYGLFGNNREEWFLIGTYRQYLRAVSEPICAERLLPNAKPLPPEWGIDCD